MSEFHEIEKALRETELFAGFSADEVAFVARGTKRIQVAKSEKVIVEGSHDDDLYLLESGKVEIVKQAKETGEHILGTLEPGATIGELSFLDSSPRSTSIRACEPATLLKIPRGHFENPHPSNVLEKLYRRIAILGSTRLRDRTSRHVESLQREIGLLRDRVNLGAFLVYLIVIFGLSGTGTEVITNKFSDVYFFDGESYSLASERLVAWVALLVGLIPTIYFVHRIKFPLKKIFTTKGWAKASWEGCLVSLPFILIFWLLVSGRADFGTDGKFVAPAIDLWTLWLLSSPDYALHCLAQEFVARGVMQNAMQTFMGDRRGVKSVLVFSLVFGILHSHLGPFKVLLTGLSGLLFGFIYLRHQNLFGVTVLHCVLGYQMRYFDWVDSLPPGP